MAPNVARLDAYHAAEGEARRAKRGVWAHSYFKPVEASRLGTQESGFRFVEGRVQRIGRSAQLVFIDLTEHFTLVIPQEDWHYFGGNPTRVGGREVSI